jgi:hypothetical protein
MIRPDSLYCELRGRIDPNFRLVLVDFDSTSDLDVLSFDAGQASAIYLPVMRWYPTGKSLVRIAGADIQKSIPRFAGEHLCNHSFNRRVFAHVRCRFIGWNDGCGLSLNERRTTAGQNGCHKE